MNTLRIGARGSDLSLAQTGWLAARLRDAHPGLQTEIVVIQTHGDVDQTSSLDKLWPPGGFVREIERALLAGEIDMAVHSLKDVPTEPVPGLEIAAIPVRAPAHDVMLTRERYAGLESLPEGFRVGSSSPRRSHQIRRVAPQVRPEPIRGNVPTRIRKMVEGQYDGVLLAAAGLERLGISHPHRIDLSPTACPPAPGQGALAAQTRSSGEARDVVAAIDDFATRTAVTAERAFLQGCGGGCHAAAGAYARVDGVTLTILGQLFVEGRAVEGELAGAATDASALGRDLAAQMLGRGAK